MLARLSVVPDYARREPFMVTLLVSLDWGLLLFVLMFCNLGLLANLPVMAGYANFLLTGPATDYLAGAVLSQGISNVPATIFLNEFASDWKALAWGVNVGGYGFVLGSLANLIALRLARMPGLVWEFHRWSVPMLLLSLPAGWLLFELVHR